MLITTGQDTKTARLTATADDQAFVGNGWMPVTGLSPEEAKAVAVFVNSTAGRLQVMRNPGRKIPFPSYSAEYVSNLRIPNVKENAVIRRMLANCWEHTNEMRVPQFRDGECEVRRLWDAAVAEAMGWDPRELARLRELLNKEPHIRGLGYNQYADELDEFEDMESDTEFEAVAEHASEVSDSQFQLVPNRSGFEKGMDDPQAMKQVLEDEDMGRYSDAQADV